MSLRAAIVVVAVTISGVGIAGTNTPHAQASCHQGTVGPNGGGDSYIYCPDGDGDWVTVNHSVCLDYPSWFPQFCGDQTSATIPGDGVFRVGTDVSPGTYKTSGSAGVMCSWSTYATLGSSDSFLDGNASTGQLYANIPTSAAAFETHGCLPWQKVG